MGTTSLQTLINLRDKLLEAFEALASEGVSSYSIGDQTYTLRDTDSLLRQIDKLDRRIAILTGTADKVRGFNRPDLRTLER